MVAWGVMKRYPGANPLGSIGMNKHAVYAPVDPDFYKLPETVKVWVYWRQRSRVRLFKSQSFPDSNPLACEVLGLFSRKKALRKTFRVELITLQYPISGITTYQATQLCEVIKSLLAKQIDFAVTHLKVDLLDYGD